jgi:hypothetical protein
VGLFGFQALTRGATKRETGRRGAEGRRQSSVLVVMAVVGGVAVTVVKVVGVVAVGDGLVAAAVAVLVRMRTCVLLVYARI